MDAFKEKELIVKKLKAQAAIAELELKILEREQDIQRIREHIKLQEEILASIEPKKG